MTSMSNQLLPPIRPVVSRSRRIATPVITAALVAATAYGVNWWLYLQDHVSTDDAFVEAQVAPISARISGMVSDVLVTDNQQVVAGQVLVRLDPRDYEVAIEQARSQVRAAEGAQKSARAAIEIVKAELKGIRLDHKRKKRMARRQLIPREEFDAVDAALSMCSARVRMARSQLEETAVRLEEAQNRLREVELQLEDTTIRAQMSGRISKKTVEVGQYVQPGQPLMALVNLDEVWVVANFKETQLTNIRPGQRATIIADVYPDVIFEAHVDSIQAGTGSRFALFPPENGSGNFVKVVQRIPVKLVIDSMPEGYPLSPGMSVIPTIQLTEPR